MSKKRESELEAKLRISERQRFIDVYNNFNSWLHSIGFRQANMKEIGGHLDCNFWTTEIHSMHSVEQYVHDVLGWRIWFMREQNRHVFYIVVGFMSRSEELTLEQFKEYISTTVKRMRDEKLVALNAIGAL
jgi:hypothetical protein